MSLDWCVLGGQGKDLRRPVDLELPSRPPGGCPEQGLSQREVWAMGGIVRGDMLGGCVGWNGGKGGCVKPGGRMCGWDKGVCGPCKAWICDIRDHGCDRKSCVCMYVCVYV